MCDPITVVAIVVGGFSVKAQMDAADAGAENAEENAQIVEDASLKNAARQRQLSEKLKARQRVAFLSAGVTLAGTPEQVLADTARDEELNAQAILQSGQINADAHRRNAQTFRDSKSGILLGGIANVAAGVIPTSSSTV